MDHKFDLIVISSYPPKGQIHGKGTVGVAMCAKNTLLSMSRGKNPPKILVLAEKLINSPQKYREDNVTVKRCWQRNSLSIYYHLLENLLQNPTNKVMIEFEVAMLGNPLINVFFPLFILILRLFGIKITVVIHQVVLNFSEISGHIGQKKDSPKNNLLSLLAHVFYRLVVLFSNQTIVFEQFLKNRLGINDPKIKIVPLGVENYKFRKLKNNKTFTITVFGFLAWYKGTDWIVEKISRYLDHHPKANLNLVIAGGPNPNHIDKPHYQQFLSKINRLSGKHPQNITITGFVPEDKIKEYYLSSDLIVLPYRVGMSSSGPLSLAFSYHTPFLISEKIALSLDTFDFKQSLEQFSISPRQVTFKLNSKDFLNKLELLGKNPKLLNQISLVSRDMSQKRDWAEIGKMYKEIVL